MKTFTIAIAAAATLLGATLINTQASAGPGYAGHGGFKSGGYGGYKPGGFRPGGYRPGMGIKRHPGHGHVRPGHGHVRPGHWGHGHGRGWGYGAVGFAGAAYFARPVYTSAYVECEWVRVRTAHGPRWRPYC